MIDRTIPMLPLVMRAELENEVQSPGLPDGYGVRFYREGDDVHWSRIQVASGAIDDMSGAMEAFRYWYPEREELPERMLFLTFGDTPVATATAWHGDGEERTVGRLHWVAVDEAHQGKGLSYPLVAMAVRRMRELGHRTAYLTTQTSSWAAIKVYHRFGFKASAETGSDADGWKIVSEKTGIDFLK